MGNLSIKYVLSMKNVIKKNELNIRSHIRKNVLSMENVIKKSVLGLFLAILVLPFTGCLEEDPCDGLDPVVIAYNEPYILRLRTQGDTSIFTNLYKIKDLVIVENGDTLDYRYLKTSTDSVIQFIPKTLSAAYIYQSFGSLMHTEIIFHYDSLQSDTMFIEAHPIEYETACQKVEYQSIELRFNESIIRQANNTTCITCSDTLVIKI